MTAADVLSSFCTCSALSLDYGPQKVSVSGDSFVVLGDDRCLHIVTRVGGNLQQTHRVTLPQPQGWWLSAVQLPGPLYAVLDRALPGRVVCVDRKGEVRHTVYSRDTSPGYQNLYLPQYMTTEQCGRLLVADTNNDGVKLVSASGSFLQRVVTAKDDGVWFPQCLCQDADSGLLAVGHRDSDTTDRGSDTEPQCRCSSTELRAATDRLFAEKTFVRRAITGDFYDFFYGESSFQRFLCFISLFVYGRAASQFVFLPP